MADGKEIKIVITADHAAALKALNETIGAVEKTGESSKKQVNVLENFKKGWLEITAATAGTILVVKSCISEYAAAEAIQVKLNTALTSAGENTAEVNKAIDDYAGNIKKMTVLDDEAVKSLITLGLNMNATAEESMAATDGAIGFSKALGIDLNTAMKASLAMEEGNMQKLTRLIPTLAAAGDESQQLAEAQKTVAKGLAQAYAETGTADGKIKIMTRSIDDMKKGFGAILADALLPLLVVFTKIVDWFTKGPEIFKILIVALVGGFAVMLVAAKLFGIGLTSALGIWGILISAIVFAVTLIIANWSKIFPFIVNLWLHKILPFLDNTWIAIRIGLLWLAKQVLTILGVIWTPFIAGIDLVIIAFNKLTGKHIATLSEMKNKLTENIDAQIAEFQREIAANKAKNDEEYKDTADKNKKEAADKKKSKAQEKIDQKKDDEAEKTRQEKLLKEKEEREAAAAESEKARVQRSEDWKRTMAESTFGAVEQAFEDEEVTGKKVVMALIKAWADMFAFKLHTIAVEAFVTGNYLKALAAEAGAVAISAGARVITRAIDKSFANGGIITEPVVGVGQNSGQTYSIAENGPERVGPVGGGGGGAAIVIQNMVVKANDARAFLNSMTALQRRMNINPLKA